MQLSTRGRYAVMAMLDLARMSNQDGRTSAVALADIAQRQDISLSYLEQLFANLRKAGLVKSMRGPGGGYLLARPSSQLAISEIIQAVNEPMEVTRCQTGAKRECEHGKGCLRGKQCNSHSLWASLGSHIESFLKQVSLAMVLDNKLPEFSMVLQGAGSGSKTTPVMNGKVHVHLS
jgi:Rrf2 family iron-sulfur cluster assembly transcriptional regulator